MTWLSDPGRVGKVVFLAADANRPELLDAALIRAGRMDVKIPMLPPAKGDAKGRWAILKSQTHKHKIVLADDLIASKNNPQAGLGRLLYDPKRIWTGAEMEQPFRQPSMKQSGPSARQTRRMICESSSRLGCSLRQHHPQHR